MAREKETILVVEDEMLIGLALVQSIKRLGYDAIGPHPTCAGALNAIDAQRPDAALLDVNLGRGQTSEEVAERLKEEGVPFAFVTGYRSRNPLPQRYPDVPAFSKPLPTGDLPGVLRSLLE